MKKILLSLLVIFSFGWYVVGSRQQAATTAATNTLQSISVSPAQQSTNTVVTPTPTPAASNTNSTPARTPAPTPTPTPTNTPAIPRGKYHNGVYTGQVADAYYGNLQVQATVQNGKLSNVQFLQYPNDRGHSIEINSYALPILRSEAIQAQSANVDIVSGATASSGAFQQSLDSALQQAL